MEDVFELKTADEEEQEENELFEVEALGGVRLVSTVHVMIFIFFASFILIHVYLGSLGHTASAHFKAMVTGYEEELEEAPPAARAG